MFSNYNFEVENFISEIRKHPVIWTSQDDPRHEGSKEEAWTVVAQTLFDGFNEQKRARKFEIVRTLRNKWRNIRDCYVRTVKNPKRNYIYKDLLTFLSSSSADRSDANESEEQSDEDLPIRKEITKTPIQDSIGSPEEILPTKKCKRENEFEYVNITYPPPITTSNQTYNSAVDERNDDDRFFFESLLPAVRDFDMDKKLEFRTEVLSLIRRYRSGSS